VVGDDVDVQLVLNGVGLKKRVGEYKHDHTATININT
jgi:hypothetical protein